MSGIKITELPAATTPLSGSELVPVVQGNVTKRTTVTQIGTVTATGATSARTLQDRFADVINVKDFGAAGDGITNDTTAFSNFNSEVSSVGNPALVPGAVYLVSNRLMNNLMPTMYTYATGLKENLVDVLSRTSPKGSQYVTRSSGRDYFSVGVRQGQKATEFNFTRNVDGLFIIDAIYDGEITPSAEINAGNFKNASNISITIGSITGSGNNYYFDATQVGFSFEISFSGTELRFNHFENTQGGVFEVFVDSVSQGTFSTWAATASTDGQKTVAQGLANTSHVAKFVFLGADPLNAPSSGGPRGWFKYDDGSPPNTKTCYAYTGAEYEMYWGQKTLIGSKILEFAINATKNNSGIAADWVPSHNNNVGATVQNSQKLFINGVQIVSSLDTYPATPQTIDDFLLEQQYTAYSTFDTLKTNPLWNGILCHKYENGAMTISHSFTTLTDVALGAAYSISLAGRGTLFVANNGYESNVVHGLDSNARSAGYCNSIGFYDVTDYGAVALSVESLADTISIGKTWQALEPTYLVDRTADAKLYYRLAQQGSVIPQGKKLSSTARIFVRAANA